MLLSMLSALFAVMLVVGAACVILSVVASFLHRPSDVARTPYWPILKRLLFRPTSILLIWGPLLSLAVVLCLPLAVPAYETHALQCGLRDATCLQISVGGLYARPKVADQLLLQSTEPGLIHELLDRISFVPEFFPSECHCGGDLRFTFYDGDAMIREFTFQHGKRIRLDCRWYGDVLLSQESQDSVREWLNVNGVEQRLEDYKRKGRAVD
jgi:hypothetical protein